MKAGFGSWREVLQFTDYERLMLFYASKQQDGFLIDWQTGAIRAPK